MKYTLCFIVSYVQLVTQHYKSRTVRKAPLQSTHTERNGTACPTYINYCLKSEVSIMLQCWLCSTHYTILRIKNCLKSTPAIKVATMKNMDKFHYEGKLSCATTKSTLFTVSKDEWDTKEDSDKSMKNALYVLWYAKRHLLDRNNIEQ